jgi:hypothetical protein
VYFTRHVVGRLAAGRRRHVVDIQAKLAQLKVNSFVFDVDLTLDEMEWSRILGPNGFGNWLLCQAISLGSDYVDIGSPEHLQNGDADVFSFEVEGRPAQFRLRYDRSFTANLLSGVREVLEGLNRELRRATVPVRFVCMREACTGNGCTYRVMLLPTAWLDEVASELNLVAGVALEDYEFVGPMGPPDVDDGFLELR